MQYQDILGTYRTYREEMTHVQQTRDAALGISVLCIYLLLLLTAFLLKELNASSRLQSLPLYSIPTLELAPSSLRALTLHLLSLAVSFLK
jgi:hypothetical protein